MEADWVLPDWSRAGGKPQCRGQIRCEPEDFQVEELPLITPDGAGSHLWLEIEKKNENTEWVARQLASLAGVQGRDVGFAGMKDRRAVTRQWFSVALQEAGDTDWSNWSLPGAVILDAHLHGRKLKRGALRGNRFRLLVRNLEGDMGRLSDRLQMVCSQGVPDYFGSQRFGHGGLNVVRGLRWLEKGGRLPRHKKSIYLSAVRSYLFNEVLSRRVDNSNWNELIECDIACLDGSHSTFFCEIPDEELQRRCSEFDIHPSGPLPGVGGNSTEKCAAEIEDSVFGDNAAMVKGLERAGLKSARRSLRLIPAAMQWEQSGTDLVLEFELPSGGYATSVLRELVTLAPVSISESK